MVAIDELKVELERIIRSIIPSIDIIRIDADDRTDSEGQRSLFITSVIKKRPLDPRELARRTSKIVDQLRTWMSGHDDDRFPYFDFLTEQDEQELQQAGE